MSRGWRWGLRSVGLALLLGLLWRADWRQLGVLSSRVDTTPLCAVPFLAVAMIGVRAWRWNLLLGLQNLQMPLRRAGQVYTAGVFLGIITPGRLGDLGKALYLRREPGTPLEQVVAGTLADRLFDLGLMLVLALWALFQLDMVPLHSLGWLMGGALALGGGAVLAIWAWGGRLVARLGEHRLWQFARGLKGEMGGVLGWLGMWALLLTLLAYGLYFAQTYLLARAVGLALSAADVTAAIVLVGLASFLPISVAGMGTREGILVLVMVQRAVPNSVEVALAYSGIFFAFCFLLPALVGYFCWLKVPISLPVRRDLTTADAPSNQGCGPVVQPGSDPVENPR